MLQQVYYCREKLKHIFDTKIKNYTLETPNYVFLFSFNFDLSLQAVSWYLHYFICLDQISKYFKLFTVYATLQLKYWDMYLHH